MTTAINFLSSPVGQGAIGLAGSVIGSSRSFGANRRQAEAFETQAASSRAAADFNAKLERLESDRRQEQLGRDLRRTLGRQQVETAVTGLAVTSKSFLQLQNEAINEFTRAMLQDRQDLSQREAVIKFEGERGAQDALARSRATRTQGDADLLSNIISTAPQALSLARGAKSLLGGTSFQTGSTGRIIGRV